MFTRSGSTNKHFSSFGTYSTIITQLLSSAFSCALISLESHQFLLVRYLIDTIDATGYYNSVSNNENEVDERNEQDLDGNDLKDGGTNE